MPSESSSSSLGHKKRKSRKSPHKRGEKKRSRSVLSKRAKKKSTRKTSSSGTCSASSQSDGKRRTSRKSKSRSTKRQRKRPPSRSRSRKRSHTRSRPRRKTKSSRSGSKSSGTRKTSKSCTRRCAKSGGKKRSRSRSKDRSKRKRSESSKTSPDSPVATKQKKRGGWDNKTDTATQPTVGTLAPGASAASKDQMEQAIKLAQLKAAQNLMQSGPPPPVDLRQGDWYCLVCHSHNYATRPLCFRCHQGTNPDPRNIRARPVGMA